MGAAQGHRRQSSRVQAFDAISRTKACEPGHSILQTDVPDCQEKWRLTASQRRGGSIDTPVARTYLASCCFAHGRRRSARLRGRLGSASTLVCRFLSCIRLPRLSSSALAISTSLTCTVITSTPTDAQETILTALEEIYNDSGPPVAATFQRWRRATANPFAAILSFIKDAHLGGQRDLVADVVCTHEFGSSHLADVSINGQLRDRPQTAPRERRKKVER